MAHVILNLIIFSAGLMTGMVLMAILCVGANAEVDRQRAEDFRKL